MAYWLRPPRLRIGEDVETEPRHATWLELFYDLVFVVAVSQLAHNLSKDISWQGFLGFIFLFIPVWWAWIGTTFYFNRFDSDDLVQRLLIGVQMLAIAALAVNIHHGLGESSAGFALAYGAARVILVLDYLWAGLHIPLARGLTTHYANGFALAALLWLSSAWIPIPFRFVVWALGLVVDFVMPLSAQQYQRRLLPHSEHLPERFGLFTMIVLGEAIIAVVNGVAERQWNLLNTLTAMGGFGIAFSLWWLYFENVGSSAIRTARIQGSIWIYQVWLYAHLPLVIGLAATGVGVEHMVTHNAGLPLPGAERWLICSSLALCFLSLAALHRTGVIFYCKARTRHRLGAAAVLLLLAIVGTNLLPIAVMATIAVIGVIQVFLDIYQGRPVIAGSDQLGSST